MSSSPQQQPPSATRIVCLPGDCIGPEHAELALRLRDLRPWAKDNLATYDERREFFADLVASELR